MIVVALAKSCSALMSNIQGQIHPCVLSRKAYTENCYKLRVESIYSTDQRLITSECLKETSSAKNI